MNNTLNIKAFGLACGILWGGGVLLMGLLSLFGSWPLPFINMLSKFYMGYSTSVAGSFIGAAWGFVDALVGGLLFSFLYNKLLPKS